MTEVVAAQVSNGVTVQQGGAPAAEAATTQQPAAAATGGTSAPVTLQPDFIEWGKTKGYDDAGLARVAADPMGYKMLTSYREAEKHLGTLQGADKLVVPKSPDDKAAWDGIYAKLGRPETAAGYKIEVPQGGDSNFALKAGEWFHGAGLNPQQAEGLTKQYNDYVQSEMQRQGSELATKAAGEVDAVTKEWGANAKLNGELASRGVNFMGKELGLPQERLDAIRNGDQVVLSAGEALKLFKLMGDLGKTTGDTFEGAGAGNRNTGLGMSPEQAHQRLNTLQNDRAFYDRLQRKDAAAIKERDDLFKIIASGTRAA